MSMETVIMLQDLRIYGEENDAKVCIHFTCIRSVYCLGLNARNLTLPTIN